MWSRTKATAYRQITRIIVAYQVAMIRRTSPLAGGEPTGTIMLMAVAKAQLNQARGCAAECVTSHGLAHSLFLPHQTFNRHADKLIDAGLCTRTDRSIALTDDPRIAALLAGLHGDVIDLFADFVRCEIALPPTIASTSDQLDREIMAYGLGLSLIGAEYNGQENANWSELNITAVVMEHNTRALRLGYPADRSFGIVVAPLEARIPMPLRDIADALAMPYSTAARHVGRMIASGRLTKHGEGLVVSVGWNTQSDVLERAESIANYTARRMTTLQEHGFDFAAPERHRRADVATAIAA